MCIKPSMSEKVRTWKNDPDDSLATSRPSCSLPHRLNPHLDIALQAAVVSPWKVSTVQVRKSRDSAEPNKKICALEAENVLVYTTRELGDLEQYFVFLTFNFFASKNGGDQNLKKFAGRIKQNSERRVVPGALELL